MAREGFIESPNTSLAFIITKKKMKRQIRLLTWVGFFFGLITFMGSFFRWIGVYQDLSSAFFGMVIGIVIIAFSYIYQRFTELSEIQEDQGRGLDIQNMWIRDELEKIKKKRIKWEKTKQK